MSSVVVLDELTINKIAAGEVVDRPSSIVKELVENSIDAGASCISVEIKNGGISYIKIVDDGSGFKSDDVELAFERHATSKIRCESDILNILSMGFRGEALASVAAISKVELVTKNKDEYTGTKIKLESGCVVSKEEVAYNKGSAITIRDIFFNTPARFKFLKKDYTEASYIYEVIVKLALSHSDISFKYINNNKEIISTLGNNDIKGDIYNIFGSDIKNNLIDVCYTENNITISGVIGNNKISRSSRTNEYIYVNNRYIKNKIITSAIEKAYDQNITINKYPFVVLNINIKPNLIDVNVHPSKLEIKFENEQDIYKAVYDAVKTSINKYNENSSPFTLNSTQQKSFIDINNDVNTL
ncbi:MAG: DNA mismatch repair endonuclease MutL [Clostridia bacterium]